jgi:hypothetical protein
VLRDEGKLDEAVELLRRAASIDSVGTPLAKQIAELARQDLAKAAHAQGP